jgi:hypothetical protein
MANAVITVLEADGVTSTDVTVLDVGRQAAAASKSVALATEDKAVLDAVATQATLASVLAKIIAAPATEAKQDTQITHLDGVETLLTAIDGRVDGLETLVTSTNTKLDSVITNTAAATPAGTNNIGDVDVLSVIPGTGATNLGKAIDAVAGASDVGIAPLAIRDDSLSALTPAEGDWTPLRVNSTGALHVTGAGGGTQFAEDDAHASGDTGTLALAVRRDTAAVGSGTDGDYSTLNVDANGRLHVNVGAGGVTSGTAGTASADVVSVQGIAAMTPILTTGQTSTALIGRVKPEGDEYETVAASQTAQALGATGATGDYIAGILVIPATTSPGNVLLLDNATSITVFAGGASSVSNLVPFFIPLGIASVSGAWKITTGANVSCIGIGNFT